MKESTKKVLRSVAIVFFILACILLIMSIKNQIGFYGYLVIIVLMGIAIGLLLKSSPPDLDILIEEYEEDYAYEDEEEYEDDGEDEEPQTEEFNLYVDDF